MFVESFASSSRSAVVGIRLFGISLGGIDKRLNRGMFYPGAVQFSYEISAYGGPFLAAVDPATVAVLTARARELKFALGLRPKGKLCARYRAIGVHCGHPQWGVGHVYYGSIVEWIFHSRKGIRKFQNFGKLAEEDAAAGRNYRYVLIGDTGEMDEDAAERIARKHGAHVQAVFLHAVAGCSDGEMPADREVEGVSFYYFRTYVGAAVKAFHHGLLDKDGLARVVEQSNEDVRIMMKSPLSALRIKFKRKYPTLKSEFERDLKIAEVLLRKERAVSVLMKNLSK